MKFHLSVLILAVSYSLVTAQPQAIPGGTGAGGAVPIGDASAVAEQLGTESTCYKRGDIVFLVDRSGGQTKEQFAVVKDFLKRVMITTFESGFGDCLRTSLVSFSKKPKVEYEFMTGNLDQVTSAIDGMKNPKGQGFTHKALLEAMQLFQDDESPSPGGNRIVVLVTDGASNDKTATIEAAKALKSTIAASLLIGKSIDPNATPVQQVNRDGEINGILANSVCGSEVVYQDDNGDPIPDSVAKKMIEDILERSDLRSTERYLCNPTHQIFGLRYNGVYVKGTCRAIQRQECHCIRNATATAIAQDDAKPDCQAGSCSITGCKLKLGGVEEEPEITETPMPDEVCED